MAMDIKEVNLECILPLRALELRAGFPLVQAIFKEDAMVDIQKKHYALFIDGHVKACLSLYKKTHSDLGAAYPWQLRGMAVDHGEQSKGLGTKLLQAILKKESIGNIWCNARKKALSFYQKHGFKRYGDIFTIKNIGPHYLAYYKGD